ncbi:aromatic/alkene monooxygenase hydroxylase subunit beta [Pigmentiphaga kullae]|uniref:Phenol 2-monooxygenase P1 subunit n=1 Tax=Pigmentiphaga kullae TaxID=151784 RepID=A0A4Q7NJG6_9BURK|nr:aromatic/alkene monooxygenase hydroxylase subunit beta [Pigmentiphaga kullae]RZS84650.1 phenol 2-monooxygenase P1 subunit [Pigmentiphaga kullae]
MQVDIKTSDIRPIRQTFSHIARRFGADKPASRYQEATYDLQPEVNFHYRPLWQPEFELYDTRRTAVAMRDWYAFKDPRHYYYGTYTQARARQQEAQESALEFVDKRGLLREAPGEARQRIEELVLPLRHYEWGANMNNCYVTAYGYGAAITQAAQYQSMDRLGLAQYLSRIGLLLDGNQGASLARAKQHWLGSPEWQGLRREMENLFVTKDWFEVFVAQDFALDGLVYPLVFQALERELSAATGNGFGMSVEFMRDWHGENLRWVDACLKTAAEESPENAALLSTWLKDWLARGKEALAPWAAVAFGDRAAAQLDEAASALRQRAAKCQIAV